MTGPRPASADRFDLSPAGYRTVMEHTLPQAIRFHGEIPEAALSEIASASGVSLEHAIFSDPQLLYEEAVRYAFAQLWPSVSSDFEKNIETAVPTESMRQLVAETMQRFQTNPQAVQLVVTENIFGHSTVSRRVDVLEQSPVILQIDRVLMRGHDLGAFRTGVSAEDVYVLILSICSFGVTQGQTFFALYDMNVHETQNQEGMVKLACDAVVAFLSTVMPTTQGNSYTHFSPSEIVRDSVAAALYDVDDFSDATPSSDGAYFEGFSTEQD